MAKEVIVTADKIKKRKKIVSTLRVATLGIFGGLFALFVVLNLAYNGGKFSITLDKKLAEEKNIILYEDSITKQTTRKLYAEDIEYMDNISINWLPKNINAEKEGSHNGDNYIAYTFYLENQGNEKTTYWYTMFIDDVIKDVDEAVRIIVYKDNERTVYAKVNPETKEAEPNTKAFYSEDIAILEKVENFQPGETHKFTIVVFIEGDDPECLNQIIGGEIRLHMEITAEKNR